MTILAFVEGLAHALGGDVLDAGLGVEAIGDDADLGASEADGRLAQVLDGHGHEGDGDLFAGGQEHVHFAGGRPIADFAGHADQVVGGVAAGADHDNDLVPGFLGPDGSSGRRHDTFRRGDAAAAEFLHNQRHGLLLLRRARQGEKGFLPGKDRFALDGGYDSSPLAGYQKTQDGTAGPFSHQEIGCNQPQLG